MPGECAYSVPCKLEMKKQPRVELSEENQGIGESDRLHLWQLKDVVYYLGR